MGRALEKTRKNQSHRHNSQKSICAKQNSPQINHRVAAEKCLHKGKTLKLAKRNVEAQ